MSEVDKLNMVRNFWLYTNVGFLGGLILGFWVEGGYFFLFVWLGLGLIMEQWYNRLPGRTK